jgi:hypothetical protein
MKRSAPQAQPLLLVGVDDDTAHSCARAVSPSPVLRARHLVSATTHVRSVKPSAVVVGRDVPDAEARALEELARTVPATVVRLASEDEDAGERVHAALAAGGRHR